MNNNIINKLESLTRIEELDPISTLKKAGLKNGMVLCDIGAGTGLFTFAANELSSSDIYALDISEDMLNIIEGKKKDISKNIHILKVNSKDLPLENNSCDMCIMVTVLHEVDNKEEMIKEIRRVLNEKGRLMIIEFYNRKTPVGPPLEERLSEDYIKEICSEIGLKHVDKFPLGDNFYTSVFEVE